MLQAFGLYTHIRANRFRTVLLLVGFVALLHVLVFSGFVILEAVLYGGDFAVIFEHATARFVRSWPVSLILAFGWFTIAYFAHQRMINAAVGAVSLDRSEAPELYNALETLCISRGMTTPRLQIMETPAMNAFASGISDKSYTVTVTRGLLDALEPDELEAVLAHELTHIRNRDTQLMVVAAIFAGVFAFIGDLFIRGWDFPYGFSPVGRPPQRDPWRHPEHRVDDAVPNGHGRGGIRIGHRVGRNARGKGSGGAVLAVIVAVAVILISWGISMLIRFALSRTREYLADAGAVELTKNPDAMVRALRKISTRAEMDVPSRMEAFFIENPLKARVGGLFSTHPDIEDRIEKLQKFAGALSDQADTGHNAAAGPTR